MTCAEVMHELESLGTEQNRKIYQRHGGGSNLFGVSYANLGKMKKKLKVDHALAQELWATGYFDARVLATMIADPEKFTSKQLDEWVRQVDGKASVDALAKMVAATPLAEEKATKWIASKNEWIGASGWGTIAHWARAAKCDDAVFEAYLPRIEAEIHSSKNRVRAEMNAALIAIGLRSAKLQKAAIAAAKRIGKVEVDHGETNCETPDAAAYILKAAARAGK